MRQPQQAALSINTSTATSTPTSPFGLCSSGPYKAYSPIFSGADGRYISPEHRDYFANRESGAMTPDEAAAVEKWPLSRQYSEPMEGIGNIYAAKRKRNNPFNDPASEPDEDYEPHMKKDPRNRTSPPRN